MATNEAAQPRSAPIAPLISDEPALRSLRVALVNMPFAAADRPSIACGLLKAALIRAGHQADVFYLNLELATELGPKVYDALALTRTDLFLGEWLFSVVAFGPRDDAEAYRAACPSIEGVCEQLAFSFEELVELRDERIPALVERWLAATEWSTYDAVGFSSSFEQNVACLALARRIKATYPHVRTVFGGANFDGEMGPEYVRAFPWIDYAVVGEGDRVLPALVARLARGQSGAGLPGVVARTCDGGVVGGGSSPAVLELDGLPEPDYDDYFATLARLGRERVLGNAPPLLLFESARGCWWGQKHHCTFCGLNANGMAFRSKSPERVRAELQRLAARYRIANFEAVDNIIDMRYLEELCAPLAEARLDYSIFYEVKANLTRAQLRTLRRGGVNSIQPGIESLSTHVLALMRKGTTMRRNVRLLKWAHYYGIRVGWNMLLRFPGETAEDYAEQARLIPLLAHLPPPSGCGPLWLERFSPYFTDPAFPVRDVRPVGAYRYIYPDATLDLHKAAYFFDYTMDGVMTDDIYAPVVEGVRQWREAWQAPVPPLLVYQRTPDWLQIVDRRAAEPRVYSFDGMEAAVYEFCGDTDHPPARVAAWLRESHGVDAGVEAVQRMLRRFCDLGLMIEEDDHFLSLALPINGNW